MTAAAGPGHHTSGRGNSANGACFGSRKVTGTIGAGRSDWIFAANALPQATVG
jgi:hypothetical protein